LNAQLAKLIDGIVPPLAAGARVLPDFVAQLRPFYTDIVAIARRLMRMRDEDANARFGATEDHRDALRYIAKTRPPRESAVVLFEKYLEAFTAKDADATVEAFVRFFTAAGVVAPLRARVAELRDALAELFENEDAAPVGENVRRLNREIEKRVNLVHSDRLGLVKSILSLELTEFPVITIEGPIQVFLQSILELGSVLLAKNVDDIEKVREMAFVIEGLPELTKDDPATDANVRKRYIEVIEKVFRIVTADAAGAFRPKMSLLLFLCHMQQGGQP
jgi:hypothetical protein